MSSLQVDSIAAIGGGHVDGTGEIVQFKQAVTTTATTVSSGTTTTILTLNFTPKFSDSLILCQGFHSNDSAVSSSSYGNSYIFAGTTEVAAAYAVGYKIARATVDGSSADARFQYGYSGSIASWGTTSLAIDLEVQAFSGNWTVSVGTQRKTSLLVWEIAQ